MKRFALVVLLLTAVAVGAFLALARPGAQASPDVTITVNGHADSNTRDSMITLREAILLSVGDLVVGGLTQTECGQVSTASWNPALSLCSSGDPPGASSADTIVFNSSIFPPAGPATITLSANLRALQGGSDTIDGSSAGVILNGATWDCVALLSDGNTIKGLQILNCSYGVWIAGGDNNTIGGSTAAERNVISGNTHGVLITAGGSGNTVKGNYIGTNAAGTVAGAAVPNSRGVLIADGAQNNTIGGSSAAERNVISSNDIGVVISDVGTNGNTVKGNYIGTDTAGTAAIPNGRGVLIAGGAQDNTVGGNSAGERNVISGSNDLGVVITDAGTNGNTVEGNYVGTNATGTAAIPNNTGVLVAGAAQNNAIGGTAAGEGNLIAFNNGDGVRVSDAGTTGNTIRGNSIHSNGGKGIENEAGGNTELAPPTITGFGSVIGTTCPNCTIDVYSDDEDEGRVYEGSTTADGTGDWSFDGLPEGPNVAATATDAAGNTSEFSTPVAVPEATPTPTPTPTPGATPTPAGPSRTLQWGPGWNNAAWSGASTPEEVFACAAGKYAAAYRYVEGGLERYFPGRPDISNMGSLAQYDAFLILITQPVTCVMPVTAASGSSRTLQWGVGWNNAGWSGADGTAPQQAFTCADGSYAAAYRYVAGGLERFFPGRPDISNMGPLNKYDAFLILVTGPVTCAMPIGP